MINVSTHKFGSTYSMRSIGIDKTDILAVGGQKSVVLYIVKDGKFSLIREFINLHAGLVNDIIFTKYYIATVGRKDSYVQMIGAEEYGPNNTTTNQKNRLEFLVPKLRADYDSWFIKTIPLPSTGFTTFEISSDGNSAILASVSTPGIVKLNLSNPTSIVNALPSKIVSSLSCTGKDYYVVAFEDDHSLRLLLSDFSEISSINGLPPKSSSKGVWANLKHFNSDDVVLWMKDTQQVIHVNSDSLTVQTLPPLNLKDSHLLLSSGFSNNMGIMGMYLRCKGHPNEDLIVVVKNFEIVLLQEVCSLLPSCKIV